MPGSHPYAGHAEIGLKNSARHAPNNGANLSTISRMTRGVCAVAVMCLSTYARTLMLSCTYRPVLCRRGSRVWELGVSRADAVFRGSRLGNLDASKICALADSQGWVLGETLENALAAREKKLSRQQ